MPSSSLNEITVKAPAKVNLMLSVHGPREDGFHALTSLMVALSFGDSLKVSRLQNAQGDQLECDHTSVPTGPENLILKAADLFRQTTGTLDYFHFHLTKRIPIGAGLGGGSSDAVAALKALNELSGAPLEGAALRTLAAGLGSDCPFFVDAVPCWIRGRGEVLEPLDADLRARLSGESLLLFQPEFPIHTAWAYQAMKAQAPESYESVDQADARVYAFEEGGHLFNLLFNSFEPVVGRKYLAIPTLLEKLRSMDIPCLMSGSGSCCFALGISKTDRRDRLIAFLKEDWGDSVFCVETSIC